MTPKQSEAVLARAARDPAWFCRHFLGVHLTDAQVRIMLAVRDNRRTAVRSGHGIGKTFVAACVALWWLYTRPSIVATTAPNAPQVHLGLWKELRALWQAAKVPLIGSMPPQASRLELATKWYGFGFTTDRPDRASGLHHPSLMLIVDEAAGIAPSILTALEGALSGDNARLLMIGNPTTTSGPFAAEFKPKSGAAKMHLTAFDSPNVVHGREVIPGMVSRAWIEEKRRIWGEGSPMWRIRVLGEFVDDESQMLIPMSWWDAACERSLEPADDDPWELGVDVARKGVCFSVIGARRGPVYRTVWRRNGALTHEVAARIRHIQQSLVRHGNEPVAKIDAGGVGGGVVDRMSEDGAAHTEMLAGGASCDPDRFANARAEWFWHLRERFDPHHPTWGGQVDVDGADEDLGAQLTSLRWTTDRRGRILIESKEDMLKRGMPSPDDADAMSMAFGGGFDAAAISINSPAGLAEGARAVLSSPHAGGQERPQAVAPMLSLRQAR